MKWFFTKNNPNGLPPLQKIKIKGKETWDDSEAMEFLEKMVTGHIVPTLRSLQDIPTSTDPADDLPF